MNSIIRPALYGAYHNIVNLSKYEEENIITKKYNVVGPICESGDIFGKDITLPNSDINDIIIIENIGAYCESMESNYNLRFNYNKIML